MSMTREELLADMGELVAGLQVPFSIEPQHSRFGAAAEPWLRLLNEATGGFGWTTADKCTQAFTAIIDGTNGA